MITQETAAEIWTAHREIAAAEKLLEDMEKESSWQHDKTAPVLKDAFGRPRHLQLGIPSGENSHRLFDVPRRLAESVIRAHIAAKQAELVTANERARIELNGVEPLSFPCHERKLQNRMVRPHLLSLPSASVTAAEVKARYRELSKTMHPDMGGSADAFAALNNAYKTALSELGILS